jgi:fluoride exporter
VRGAEVCAADADKDRFRLGVIKMKPLDVMWVGLGGGLGSVLRWWVGRVVGERYRGDFPLGTFLINVSGTFLIGYLSVLFGVDWHDRYGHGMVLNAFVLTGVLGGYTTFSSMQLDAVKLSDKKRGVVATSYLLLSVAAGLLTGQIGAALARAQG